VNFVTEKIVTKITVSFAKRVAKNRNLCYNAINENLRKRSNCHDQEVAVTLFGCVCSAGTAVAVSGYPGGIRHEDK
jgi:hypothetical protein